LRNEAVEYYDLRLLHEELSVAVGPAALSRIRDVVVKGVEVGPRRIAVDRVEGKPRLRREVFLDAAASKVVEALPEYLCDAKHLDRLRETVSGWLDSTGPREDWVSFDPVEVASALTNVLQKDAMKESVSYIDDGLRRRVEFPEFSVSVPVEPGSDGLTPMPSLDLVEHLPHPDTLWPGMVCKGFQRSLHPAYSFDVIPEYRVALALDRSSQIDWWVRNQPRRMRIDTPAGRFFPDFIVFPLPSGAEPPVTWLLEVKGDLYWDPPDSPARVKSRAATEWCRRQPETLPSRWRHGVILESETESCDTWEDILSRMERPQSIPPDSSN
jgi:hypothetical protein